MSLSTKARVAWKLTENPFLLYSHFEYTFTGKLYTQIMADRIQLGLGCHAYIEGVETSYGYVPSLGAGIAYCTLFGISMILHTIQFTWKRQWWASVFSIGCLGE